MGSYKGFSFRVSAAAITKWARATGWRESPFSVATNNLNIWLIEGNPVLDSISKWLKANICIISEILSENKKVWSVFSVSAGLLGEICSKLEWNWMIINSLHHTGLGDSTRLHIYLQVSEGCHSESMSQMVLSLKQKKTQMSHKIYSKDRKIVRDALKFLRTCEDIKYLFWEENQWACCNDQSQHGSPHQTFLL